MVPEREVLLNAEASVLLSVCVLGGRWGRAAGGRLASSSESWRRGGRGLEVELKEEVLNSSQKQKNKDLNQHDRSENVKNRTLRGLQNEFQ